MVVIVPGKYHKIYDAQFKGLPVWFLSLDKIVALSESDLLAKYDALKAAGWLTYAWEKLQMSYWMKKMYGHIERGAAVLKRYRYPLTPRTEYASTRPRNEDYAMYLASGRHAYGIFSRSLPMQVGKWGLLANMQRNCSALKTHSGFMHSDFDCSNIGRPQ